MKKYFSVIVLTIMTLLSSCEEPVEKTYDEHGVSFTIPSGWKLSKDKDNEQESHFISVEKRGFNASGIVSLTWVVVDVEPYDFVETMIETLEERDDVRKLKYTSITDCNYGIYEASGLKYTCSYAGIPHSGSIRAFCVGDRAFCIMHQEADEDHRKNAKGFEVFEQSFSVDNSLFESNEDEDEDEDLDKDEEEKEWEEDDSESDEDEQE